MTEDFRAMAAGLKTRHAAELDAQKTGDAKGRDERHREMARHAEVLRSTILPILTRAKKEIGEEGIPSELKETFDPSTSGLASVSLRFVGPKAASALEPRSKILFFVVEEDRIEAKVGKSYFAHREHETDCSGSRPLDAPDIESWVGSKVKEILESYFANSDGRRV